MKKTNTLILLRGLPGAGKTTLANMLADEVHSADDYFYENGPNVDKYDFDASKLGAAHGQCKTRVENAMKSNVERIVVANTNTTEKEINPYIKLAESYGYQIISLVVENRHGNKSVHGVPSDVLDAMEKRFTIKLK